MFNESAIWDRLDAEYREWPQAAAQPGTPAEVEAAEAQTGLVFPPAYREFLLRYGGAYVGAFEIFGIREPGLFRSGGEEELNRVVAKQRFYKEQQGFPGIESWLVFSEDGYGNPIGIAPDGSVLRIDHDCGMEITVLAPSFLEFLAKQIPPDSVPTPNIPSERRLPELVDCEQIGKKHHWFNHDDVISRCYNCQVERKGQFWREPAPKPEETAAGWKAPSKPWWKFW